MTSSGKSTTNTWITGGAIGSKNAVLVFRTAALACITNTHEAETEMVPIKQINCSRNSDNDEGKLKKSKSSLNRCRTLSKNTPSNTNSLKRHTKNQPNDSLSSSENSISSIENDLIDSESDGKRSIENTPSTSMIKDDNGSHDEEDTYISDMPAAVLKLTYKFTNTETKVLKRILSSHGLQEANENQSYNLLWTGLHMKPDVLRSLTPYQRINHFPR